MIAFRWPGEWPIRRDQTIRTLNRRREAIPKRPSVVGHQPAKFLSAELEVQLRPDCGECGQLATLAALVHQIDSCDQLCHDVGWDGARIWLLCTNCVHTFSERVAAEIEHRVNVAHARGGGIGCNSCGRQIEKFHDVVEFATINAT